VQYTDAARFEREQERIFRRTWQFAGHVSQLERPGDYFALELHGRSLFCVKDREGVVRAFYNACRHRAHQLVEGSGHARALVCPYHAWTYELDGRLRAAPGASRTPGFDRSRICLTPARSEIVGGFVFVNLDPDAAPMEAWYPGIANALAEYVPHPERLRAACTREVVERCNWKVSVENYSECYHCRLNHPTFSNGVVEADSYHIIPHGRVLRHVTKSVPVESLTYRVDPDSHPRALDYTSWFLWPTFSFQIYPGNVLNTYIWRAVDHRTTRVTRQWYAAEGVELIDGSGPFQVRALTRESRQDAHRRLAAVGEAMEAAGQTEVRVSSLQSIDRERPCVGRAVLGDLGEIAEHHGLDGPRSEHHHRMADAPAVKRRQLVVLE